MDSSILAVAAKPARQPMHDDLNPESIASLVDNFYFEIRKDARLGPIFEERVSGNWDPHLARMKQFWRSVLLKTGEYSGRPVPIHVAMIDIESEDFRRWLALFNQVAEQCFPKEAATIVTETAQRIAQSLWLAKFATPTTQVPDWLKQSDSAALQIESGSIGQA